MKKNVFKLFLCVLALVTVITAFAVVAFAADVTETKGTCTVTYTDDTKTAVKSVTGGKIYVMNKSNVNATAIGASSAKSLWQWNYHDFGVEGSANYKTAQYAAADLAKLYGDTRTEYGLRYDLSEDGTLTIYAASEADETTAKNYTNAWKIWGFPNGLMEYLQQNDAAYEGGWFKRTQVKKVVIEAKITAITEQSLNAFSNCTEIIMPASVVRLDGSAFARTNYLKSVKVAGADYTGYNSEYVVDLRNITSYSANSLSETFHGVGEIYPVQILINDTLGTKANRSFSNASSKNSYEDALSAKSAVGAISVYTSTGESCKWIEDIADRDSTWTSGRVSYYTVTVYKLGETNAVSHLGYQVRTKDYNGLRAAFNFGAPEGLKVVENGVVLETPEKITGSADGIVEYGVIVATEANADTYGLELTKNGDVWETANAKIKKIAAEEDKVDANGNFFVTVTNFSGKEQMGTKICYRGYEIHGDGSVVYASTLDSASIFDATIGSFEKGLVNSSSGDYDIFWDVLNNFKVDMKAQMWDGDDLKSNIAARLKNETVYYSSQTATSPVNGCNGTDYTANFKYSATDDGDLVWSGRPNTLVSFIEKSNGEYVILVHLTKSAYETYLAKPTTINYFESNKMTKSYVGESFLSTNFTGLAAKSLVIDDGITNISQDALKGFGSETFSWFVGDTVNARTAATVEYKGAVETIIIPASVKTVGSNGSQSFHSNQNLKTVYHFGTSETGATEGLVDVSTLLPALTDAEKAKAYGEWFNRARAMTAIKLPERDASDPIVLGGNFLMQCKSLTTIYVGDTLVTKDNDSVQGKREIDLTGTGYSFLFDGTTIKTFDGANLFGKITQSNGDVWTRANTWATTWAKQ